MYIRVESSLFPESNKINIRVNGKFCRMISTQIYHKRAMYWIIRINLLKALFMEIVDK